MNKNATNIGLLTFVIITWGYSWVLMKIGLNYAEPFTFAAWRCAIGGISLIPVLIFMSSKLPAKHKLKDYLAVGFFQTTAMFGLMLYGMKHVSAGKTAVLLYTMPPIITPMPILFPSIIQSNKRPNTGTSIEENVAVLIFILFIR